MKLPAFDPKSITPFPVIKLDGRICLPCHLVPDAAKGDFDVDKFVREFRQRRRYLSAVNVMTEESTDSKENTDATDSGRDTGDDEKRSDQPEQAFRGKNMSHFQTGSAVSTEVK